jgi:chorismate mutase / prephenate dehydratase
MPIGDSKLMRPADRNMGNEETLRGLRTTIETLDGKILRLLNERAEIALEVGKVKAEANITFYNPQREEEILQRLRSENAGPFPRQAISPVFREIISACRSLQTEVIVSFLGPATTYTHLACLEHFGSSIRTLSQESIQDVFASVEMGEATHGVVPVENSTEGTVDRTLDMFIESDLKICGEVFLRISHTLFSQTGAIEDIRVIYSHPQALGQCRKWMKKNTPHVTLTETASTAKAAELAAQDTNAAAIASSFAGRLYGLKAVSSQIEDSLQNFTRFLVIGRQPLGNTGKDKTSLLFLTRHTPGTLYGVLKIFAEKRINLTKIESRPMKGEPWEYIFFVDVEGHTTDSNLQEALVELKDSVIFMKILGSYPRSSWRDLVRE